MAQKRNNNDENKKIAFSVQDEIRRDRRIRQTGRVRRVRNKANTFFTAVLCVAICILLIVAVGITVTRVKTVNVVGNLRYSAEEIQSAAKLDGEIMPLLGEKTVYRRISEVCPYVDSVELVKEYPSTLTVEVFETEAVFAVRTHDRTLTLDRALRVMDYTDNIYGLILLILPELRSAVEGKRIVFADEEMSEYVDGMLEQFVESNNAEWLTELDVTDRFALKGRAANADIVFGDYKNIPEKLTMAEKLLSDAEAEYAKYAYIDVSVLSQASLKLEY